MQKQLKEIQNLKMYIQKKYATIALALILLISASMIYLPTAKADVLPTYLFLSISPNPIGVEQTLSVNFWLDKVTPTASGPTGDRWEDITVAITRPDGTSENKGPFTFDAVASGSFKYTPTQIGTYTFQASFPGQDIVGWGGFFGNVWTNNTYLQSTSPEVELTVQTDPILGWPETPISELWTRPINAENHDWSSVAGYWLGSGAAGGPHGPRTYGTGGNYNPYSIAPDAPHVLWTKEIAFGGIVGGEYGDTAYYPGETYERKLQPPVVMNGRLYYNQRIGSSTWGGLMCVDIQTGETLWYNEDAPFMRFGQLLDIQTPNQHGVIPYLWAVSGSTYKMFDPFTGDWILDIANVSSGTFEFGPSGEIMIYNIAGTSLTAWNSTKAINPTIDRTWSWRPSMGAVLDGNKGYEFNVTVASPAGRISRVYEDVIYANTGNTWFGYDRWTGAKLWSVDVNKASYPEAAQVSSKLDPGTEILVEFVRDTMQWYGYNVRTGVQAWGPTEPYENAWGYYQVWADYMTANGKLYATGYDGIVHCYDLLTGENLWNYYTGNSGSETVYGHWVAKDNALTITEDTVFVVNNEHSPSTPFYRGSKMHCIDDETGEGIWNMTFMGLAPIVVDDKVISLNYFDNQIYCLGKGPSATTIDAPQNIVEGNNVVLMGTVTDQTPASIGTPAISDEDISLWMDYLYMQQQIPGDAKGVTLMLNTIDPNGNFVNIGTTTSDMSGTWGLSWIPEVPGLHKVIATFAGSASYASSYAETFFFVEEAPVPTAPPEATPAPMTDTYLTGSTIAILAGIAIAVFLILRKK